MTTEATGSHNLCNTHTHCSALHDLTRTACYLLRVFPEHVMACNVGTEHVQWQEFAVSDIVQLTGCVIHKIPVASSSCVMPCTVSSCRNAMQATLVIKVSMNPNMQIPGGQPFPSHSSFCCQVVCTALLLWQTSLVFDIFKPLARTSSQSECVVM